MKKVFIFIFIISLFLGLSYYSYIQYNEYKEEQQLQKEKQKEINEIKSLLLEAEDATIENKIDIFIKLKEKKLYTDTGLKKEILNNLQKKLEIRDTKKVFKFLEEFGEDFQEEKEIAYIRTVETTFKIKGKISKSRYNLYKSYLENLYNNKKLDFKDKITLLMIFYSDKKIEKIKNLETNLLNQYKNNPELYYKLANIHWTYAEKKDIFHSEILNLYEKAIELDPKKALYYSVSSTFLAENMQKILSKKLLNTNILRYSDNIWTEINKKYGKKSLEYAKKAVEIEPNNALYYYKLGNIYLRGMSPGYRSLGFHSLKPLSPSYYDTSGNLPKVIESAKKSVELEPDNEFYAKNLMNLAYYFNKDDYRETAIKIAKDFFDKHPNNYSILNNYAVLITQKPTKESLEQALVLMEKAYKKQKLSIKGEIKTVFNNYLQIASIARDREKVKELLKEMDYRHYNSLNLLDTYPYGEALLLMGEKELGNTLKSISILTQTHYSHLNASQVLSYYDIYLTDEDIALIKPMYGNHPKYNTAEVGEKIISTLRKRIKIAIEKL